MARALHKYLSLHKFLFLNKYLALWLRPLALLMLFFALTTNATAMERVSSEQINAKAVVENPAKSTLNVGDRAVEVWSWQPEGEAKGVILFSHGAASAPWKYDPLINAWVAAGYAVHGALHVDSTDHPEHDKYPGPASWKARLEDAQLLADTYGQQGYIAAGHSYGGLLALTKGGVSAAVPTGYEGSMGDDRVKLVLAFSPPGAIPNFADKDALTTLAVPALIQTGTKDIPFGSELSWVVHLDAYNSAPAGGDRYALVLEGVDHYFGGEICRPELPGPKNTKEIAIAAEISLLMLDAYSQNSAAALAALQARLSNEGDVVLTTK